MRGKARMTVFMPGPKARTFNDQAGDVGYVPCGRVPLYSEHWGRDTDLSESVQFQPLLGYLSGAVDGEHAQRGHILTTKETGGYWVRKCKKCAGIGRRKDNGCFAWWCRQELCANLFADSGVDEVKWQQRHPRRWSQGASYSCTSCCPTGCQPHGAGGHRLA